MKRMNESHEIIVSIWGGMLQFYGPKTQFLEQMSLF